MMIVGGLAPWRPDEKKTRGRPPLDARQWDARAVACALTALYQRQTGCSWKSAARWALAAWPRRSLPAERVDTLLTYRALFERRAGWEQRGRPRSPAADAAASYYSAVCTFGPIEAGVVVEDVGTNIRHL